MSSSPTESDLPQQVLTILAAQDLAASADFYEKLLGWERTVDVPVYVQLTAPGGLGLGIYERESYGVNTGQVPPLPKAGHAGGAEIYFYCKDLEERVALAESLGARPLSPLSKRMWGDEVAYFADPDENVVALARPPIED
ncbi:MAG: VOC family protein [Planctomycetota bacterium]|nr:VOC family protein [Planctomycetota bacterium]